MKKLSFTLFALLLTVKAFCQQQNLLNPDISESGQPSLQNWNIITNWAAGKNLAGNNAAIISNVDVGISDLSQTSTLTVAGAGASLRIQFTFDWTATEDTKRPTDLNVSFVYNNTPVAVNVATISTPSAKDPGPATATSNVEGGTALIQPNLNSGTVPQSENVSLSVPLSTPPKNGESFTLAFTTFAPFEYINELRITNVRVFLDEPLPVTLEYFTGTKQQKNVMLQWKTAMEDNLDRYEVEQSANGADYTRVGTVAPHGIGKPYEFNNENALSGNVYFRLKSVDKDGTFKYSRTLNFKMENSDDVTIFPNPVTDQLSVKGKFTVGKSYNVRIVNTVGQTVKTLEYTPTQDGLISLNQVSALPQGVYLLEVADNGIIARERFVR